MEFPRLSFNGFIELSHVTILMDSHGFSVDWIHPIDYFTDSMDLLWFSYEVFEFYYCIHRNNSWILNLFSLVLINGFIGLIDFMDSLRLSLVYS